MSDKDKKKCKSKCCKDGTRSFKNIAIGGFFVISIVFILLIVFNWNNIIAMIGDLIADSIPSGG
jgi:hypothetical protein